jgi:hypothetical protein
MSSVIWTIAALPIGFANMLNKKFGRSRSESSGSRIRPTTDRRSELDSVLYDAFGYQKRGTILDWGFSALVHYNGKTILFDTGNGADSFEHNLKALGVDLSQVDIAVLSHRRGKDLSSSCQGGKGVGKRHLAECRVVRSQGLLRESGLGAYCAA